MITHSRLLSRSSWLALSIGLLSAEAKAQGRPDFSGTWQLSASPPAAVSKPLPIKEGATLHLVSQLVIRQSGNRLYVDTPSTPGGLRSVYALDGSETVNKVRNGQKFVDKATRVHWVGDTLVIDGHVNGSLTRHRSTVRLALSPLGKLVLQVSDSGRHMARGIAVYERRDPVVP